MVATDNTLRGRTAHRPAGGRRGMGLTMVYGREAGRRKVGAVLAGAALLLGAAGLPRAGAHGSDPQGGQLVSVIVQEVPGAAAQAIQAVQDAGGTIGREI